MKKIILLLALAIGSVAQAQVTVYGNDDVVITEGYTYTTNSLLSPEAGGDTRLSLIAHNNGTETIYVQLKMNSIENGAGNQDNIQFCFQGSCYFQVDANDVVPTGDLTQLGIAPNGHNPVTDHFESQYEGDTPGQPVVYHMSLIKVDVNGNFIENIISNFIFKYQPTLGLTDNTLQNIGITVKNTVVKNQLELNATTNATLQLVNINGQVVKTVAITNGAQAVDLSALSNAVYFARFTTADNKTSQIKIVKN